MMSSKSRICCYWLSSPLILREKKRKKSSLTGISQRKTVYQIQCTWIPMASNISTMSTAIFFPSINGNKQVIHTAVQHTQKRARIFKVWRSTQTFFLIHEASLHLPHTQPKGGSKGEGIFPWALENALTLNWQCCAVTTQYWLYLLWFVYLFPHISYVHDISRDITLIL